MEELALYIGFTFMGLLVLTAFVLLSYILMGIMGTLLWKRSTRLMDEKNCIKMLKLLEDNDIKLNDKVISKVILFLVMEDSRCEIADE